MMNDKYLKWIAENVTEQYGKCKEVTDKMKEVFPELQQIRGHYYCHTWGERAHWWLTDEDGTIIDPTKEQFPSKGNGPYEPWIEGSPEPTGKCPNCGELIYHGGYTCNESCHNAYVSYCTSF
jgi:hypothetical protein